MVIRHRMSAIRVRGLIHFDNVFTEVFPTRISYTSMSLPYHIGNGWLGGSLPTTAFAVTLLTGNIFAGLRYPIIIALITFVISTFFLPETEDVDITK